MEMVEMVEMHGLSKKLMDMTIKWFSWRHHRKMTKEGD